MSWRQPSRRAEKSMHTASPFLVETETLRDSDFRFIDPEWFKLLEKLPGHTHVEFFIARLDAKEKPPPRDHGKARHVEKGVIGRRQTIHRQHSKSRRQRGTQDRQFKSDGNEGRPAIEGLAVHVQWETQHVCVPLQKKAA